MHVPLARLKHCVIVLVVVVLVDVVVVVVVLVDVVDAVVVVEVVVVIDVDVVVAQRGHDIVVVVAYASYCDCVATYTGCPGGLPGTS